jgi:phosphatidylserine/phosphatidylglycerophosphate/cardiolipin synthase-like enzyme
VVSAYFTIYAHAALKSELDAIAHMRFLFGEPTFVKSLDPDKTATKAFIIEAEGLKLASTLQQKKAAKECADWIREKVEVKSVKQTNFLHAKLYHASNSETDAAILGSSNFTPKGLGLHANGSNIELNLAVENPTHRDELKAWFDRLWDDPDLVADVKDDVLLYLAQIYQNHPPEFVYYKTLYHIFEKFLGEVTSMAPLALW